MVRCNWLVACYPATHMLVDVVPRDNVKLAPFGWQWTAGDGTHYDYLAHKLQASGFSTEHLVGRRRPSLRPGVPWIQNLQDPQRWDQTEAPNAAR